MQELEVRTAINAGVTNWLNTQKLANKSRSVSSGAVSVLVHLVNDISENPHPAWEGYNVENAQEFGITLIGNVLNDIDAYKRFSSSRHRETITAFDVWHSVSRIVDRWCFIPKDI
jgi:hypothetical protein